MNQYQKYAVGDDIDLVADVLLNGVAPPYPLTGATIKAAIVKPGKSELAPGTSVVTCTVDSVTTNRITAFWPRTQTGSLVPGPYEVEVTVEAGGRENTADRVTILIAPRAIP